PGRRVRAVPSRAPDRRRSGGCCPSDPPGARVIRVDRGLVTPGKHGGARSGSRGCGGGRIRRTVSPAAQGACPGGVHGGACTGGVHGPRPHPAVLPGRTDTDRVRELDALSTDPEATRRAAESHTPCAATAPGGVRPHGG